MLTAIASSPATADRNLSARREAGRLQSVFSRSGSQNEFPALPLAMIFNDPDIFQSAYPGKEGFARALDDLFGLQGNHRHLYRSFSNENGFGDIWGNPSVHARYNVAPEHLMALCDKMTAEDRTACREAFNEFTGTLAVRYAVAPFHMATTIRPLARLEMAFEQGAASLNSRNEDILLKPFIIEMYRRTGDAYVLKRLAELSRERQPA